MSRYYSKRNKRLIWIKSHYSKPYRTRRAIEMAQVGAATASHVVMMRNKAAFGGVISAVTLAQDVINHAQWVNEKIGSINGRVKR